MLLAYLRRNLQVLYNSTTFQGMEVVATEFALCHSFGKRNVGGVIDVIFRTPDNDFVIIDNKIGSLPGTRKQRDEFRRWVCQVNEVLIVFETTFMMLFSGHDIHRTTLQRFHSTLPSSCFLRLFITSHISRVSCAQYLSSIWKSWKGT
jgi:hypothetical protein